MNRGWQGNTGTDFPNSSFYLMEDTNTGLKKEQEENGESNEGMRKEEENSCLNGGSALKHQQVKRLIIPW